MKRMIEPRQLALLQGLVQRETTLRAEGRPTDFLLIQMPGPSFGLKPGIADEREIAPTEADIHDLHTGGFVSLMASNSQSVVARFALTVAGRSAGESRAVTADLQLPRPATAPPSTDAVLQWLHGLSASAEGSALLSSGGALANEALHIYGQDHIETVARRVFDLRDGRLLLIDDIGAEIQVSDAEQLAMAQDIRLSTTGLDRVESRQRPAASSITQIINATQAQVAAGDIHNYSSYDELIDRLAEALSQLDDIDDDVREEARGLLDKLRSASGQIAVGAAASSGGAVLGTLLKHALNL
jgi:hypothetical protein